MSTTLYVRKLDDRRFDVFEGNQWGHLDGEGNQLDTSNTWSRLAANKNNVVYVQKGRSLTPVALRMLVEQINPRLQEQFITFH
jgi:hypothetical protein